jgi:hypothetical protein
MTKEQVLAGGMALDPRERQAVAEQLLLSLGEADQAAIDAAWLEEARRREEAFARGEMSTSPVDDAIARVLSKARP